MQSKTRAHSTLAGHGPVWIVVSAILITALLGISHAATREPAPKWQTYHPEGGVKPCDEKVCLGTIRLLTGTTLIEARTTSDDLVALIEQSVHRAKEVLAAQDTTARIIVQFICTPGGHDVNLYVDGVVNDKLLQTLYDRLKDIEPIEVSGEVRFEFTLSVAP